MRQMTATGGGGKVPASMALSIRPRQQLHSGLLRPSSRLLNVFAIAFVVTFGVVSIVLHHHLGSVEEEDQYHATVDRSSRSGAKRSRIGLRQDKEQKQKRRRDYQRRRFRREKHHEPPPAQMKSSIGGNSTSTNSDYCQTLYFWGGHKSGSTTLAALVKHVAPNFTEHDPHGEFVAGPKEVCWALLRGGGGQQPNSAKSNRWDRMRMSCGTNAVGTDITHNTARRFALDGCPFYRSEEHARVILDRDPTARFVMLVRNPVDRLVSHLNADRRGRKRAARQFGNDLDEEVRKIVAMSEKAADRSTNLQRERGRPVVARRDRRRHSGSSGANQNVRNKFAHIAGRKTTADYWSLSTYGNNLRNLLNVIPDPSSVLVVQTTALTNRPQEVIDQIMAHINGSTKEITQAIRQNCGGAIKGYHGISLEVRKEAEGALRSDIRLLEDLVGKKFSWSYDTSTYNTSGIGQILNDTLNWTAALPKQD